MNQEMDFCPRCRKITPHARNVSSTKMEYSEIWYCKNCEESKMNQIMTEVNKDIRATNAPSQQAIDEAYKKGWEEGYEACRKQYWSSLAARQEGLELGIKKGYQAGIERCIGALQAIKEDE